jgi:hypothetical protein
MFRSPNTSQFGGRFTAAEIVAVWQKAQVAPGYDPAVIRRDGCGAFIAFSNYGQTVSLGWEIDHAFPIARGGTDVMSNLQPLQWENNRHKGDSWPNWTCAVRAA